MKTEHLPEAVSVADIDLAPDWAVGLDETQAAIGGQAGLVFEEHCTECAHPVCYATCTFYTPRSDLNCRRFVAGFEPVAGRPDLQRVRFRKWGKIETLVQPDAYVPDQGKIASLGRQVSKQGLPYFLRRRASYFLGQARRQAVDPAGVSGSDALVLEAIAADGRDHVLTISVFNVAGSRQMFQTRMRVSAAYGRRVIPLTQIGTLVDLTQDYLIQIEPMDEAEGREILFGLCDFVTFQGPGLSQAGQDAIPGSAPIAVQPAAQAKLVVWDLDDTLWHGTLVEDGVEGVRLRAEAVAAIRSLDARGVLHSVASKNDPALAMAALQHFGLEELFLVPQVSWGPKSDAIRTIAARLSLGIDSFVFLDDQPFERAEVAAAHPQIRVLSQEAAESLADQPFFPTEVTAESARRREMYREDAARNAAFETVGTDYAAFLRQAGMTLTIERLSAANQVRMQELTQRTNQLNFKGEKLGAEAISDLMKRKDRQCLVLSCEDRFGAYGQIGFVVLDPAAGRIESFFMSCRAQKKRVEEGFFEWLRQRLLIGGANRLEVGFVETARNGAAVQMLQDLAFERNRDDLWSRSLDHAFEGGDVIAVCDRSDPETIDGGTT